MVLKLEGATITASSKGFSIKCKVRELKDVFKELFRIMSKDTKVGDVKKNLIKKLH